MARQLNAQPRDFQQQAVVNTAEHLYNRGFGGTVIHFATGLGKTLTAALFVHEQVDLDKQRVLFIVHTRDLVFQAYNAFKTYLPYLESNAFTVHGQPGIGIVMGKLNQPNARIVVGTPQTLAEVEGVSSRLEEVLKHGAIDVCIIDEAHYGASPSYLQLVSRLWDENNQTKRIGLTATPLRSDGLALRQPLDLNIDKGLLFNTIAISRNLRWGINNGYLCPIQPPLLVETNMVLPDGTGSMEERARLLDVANWAEVVVDSWVEHGENRLSAYFLQSVAHSKQVAQEFCDRGYRFVHIDGECVIDGDREFYGAQAEKARLLYYEMALEGKIQGFCNFNVLTTGWDMPPLSLIGLARPTESSVLVTQIIGRGTRLHKNKQDLRILDYALKGVPVFLSGDLLGYVRNEKGEIEEVEDEEVELLAEDVDLRDDRESGVVVNGNGVVVRLGNLFKQQDQAWYYDPVENDACSTGLSNTDILYIKFPNYTAANKLAMGMAKGESFLAENPDHRDAQIFYQNLTIAKQLFGNYTLWHIKGKRVFERTEWEMPKRWIAEASSIELLFDNAVPLIAQLEDPQLARKSKSWRRDAASNEQKQYIRQLGGKRVPETKDEGSKMIAHLLAGKYVEMVIDRIRKACGNYAN